MLLCKRGEGSSFANFGFWLKDFGEGLRGVDCNGIQSVLDCRSWCSGITQDSHSCDPGFFPRRRMPFWASLVAQRVKHLPAIWETWVQFLGWEDPLEKAMVTHSSTLLVKSHGRRSLVGCNPWGHKESDMTEQLHFHFLK